MFLGGLAGVAMPRQDTHYGPHGSARQRTIISVMLTLPNYCWICTKAVLTASNFVKDGYGFRVHEDCYLKAAKDSVAPTKSA